MSLSVCICTTWVQESVEVRNRVESQELESCLVMSHRVGAGGKRVFLKISSCSSPVSRLSSPVIAKILPLKDTKTLCLLELPK